MSGDVEGLIERLETATEGSRELDAAIALAVAGWSGGPGKAYWTDNNGRHRNRPPEWTKSIDAALALVERKLGHAATVEPCINIGAAQHSCSIHLYEREEPVVTENLRTPALAIVAALLRALGETP
jgi:hypothetical protein